jgi:hypothetical protein
MKRTESGIKVEGSEITLSPPTEGCNLVTVKVSESYSLHIFTHAGRGHSSVSIHPCKNSNVSHIDVMGKMELRKVPVRKKEGGFDYFEISNLTPPREA